MRTAGLLTLAILLPALAHASDPPVLTTYTVSNDTIYPSAANDSGLATSTSIDVAFSESVKTSIKIVSLTGATIKSLYTSSSVTNPTPKLWDGTNTAGARVDDGTYRILIAATSTATSLALTDASKTIVVASASGTSNSPSNGADTSDSVPVIVNAESPEYIPIPVLYLTTSGARTISSGAEVAFTTSVYDGKGVRRDDAVVTWTFGDGMRKVGASVFHEYYDPGEYLAVVRATTPDGGMIEKEILVTVKDANLQISSVSSRGIALTNKDSRTLDLSLWRLSAGGQEFKIPEDTQILAGRTLLFSSKVIELPITSSAFLLYPSGEVAAAYPTNAIVQPSSSAGSYEQVQEVEPPAVSTAEPIISTKEIVPVHDEAVGAPAAANELAAAGAALPEGDSRAAGVFTSPWTLGFLGTVLLTGGAFILL